MNGPQILATALALTLLFALPSGMAAQATGPVAVKNAFDAALNAHDVDAALATFADDAVFRTPGGMVLTGKPQIRPYLQGLVAENYRAEVVETRQVAADTVTSRGHIAVDQFRRLGLASVEATAEAVVRGGRITSFATALTPAGVARVQAAQAAAARGMPLQLPRTGQTSTVLAGTTLFPPALAIATALAALGAAQRASR
jgi:uncharacterized protein (TIGR02246 family)